MLPTAAALYPPAMSIDSVIWVVVVLPLVPVMPSQGTTRSGCMRRQASSGSPHTGTSAARAWAMSGWVGRHPGETMTRSVPGGSCAVDPAPSRTEAPRTSSRLALSRWSSSSRSSRTSTEASRSSSASAAAKPDIPRPAMTTCTLDQSKSRSARSRFTPLTVLPPIRRRRFPCLLPRRDHR